MKFSERNGFNEVRAAPITSRLEASEELRSVVVSTALDSGFKPDKLRELLCRLHQRVTRLRNPLPFTATKSIK